MEKSQVFYIKKYLGSMRHSNEIFVIVFTPEPVAHEKVYAAWSYALKYTAKNLEEPDNDAALKLMFERHPSWSTLGHEALTVVYNKSFADKDVAESE